jgi:3D (Asp-Asp-Asp) domain-containing protein
MKARWAASVVLFAAACGGSGQDWVKDLDRSTDFGSEPPVESQAAPAARAPTPRTVVIGGDGPASAAEPAGDEGGEAVEARAASGGGGPFRNTYYDFPAEAAAGTGATIFDAACKPIANVDPAFHDAVCVQGSGRLATGVTVSFAKRDCACASVCPRTGQRICFERLDPTRFPWGRGATGKPITPLRTVAVDSSVIPLGARIFIPEAVGIPRPDGTPHDGCFVAEDRGRRVVGMHVDVFTGDPATTALWNARLPSNRGVHVVVGDARCAR